MRLVLTILTVLLFFPLSSLADLKIELTKARVARGEYLVMNVAGCDGCHGERALDRYGYPPKESMMMAGGLIFAEIGVATPNITPYALASWSDQQIFTALTKGVAKDGHVLNPAMPYQTYGSMDPKSLTRPSWAASSSSCRGGA